MVYSAPNFSFIEAFTNNAKSLDDKTEKRYKDTMEGFASMAKGAGDAWKWQQRKEAADKLEAMQKELAALKQERENLISEKSSQASDYLGSIMNSTGWQGVPYPYEQNQPAPAAGVGIYKKELL